MERSRSFETQHKLLLLETLYDAGLSLGAMPNEQALVDDVLSRAVGVLDASRGYLATFGEGDGGGPRRAEARVGIPKRPPEAVVAQDEFLSEVLQSEGAITREKFKLLRTPILTAVGARILGGGRPIGVLVLADKEARRGGQAAFDEDDRRFLVSLAGLCGMAIENRRHLERLTRDRERLEEENRRLLDETGRSAAGRLFVGDSPPARRVLDLVGRVASSKISVLVTGESGTGKELVARMIHAKSDRAEKPFVAINCAALPESLLESELFGIERGVATGVEARAGRFEAAQAGTLFLDEIGDMPLALQSKLLRVLQEREIERVGGRRRVAIDVRVLAATHANLAVPDRARRVPGGSVLPAAGRRDRAAPAAGAARGHPEARTLLPRPLRGARGPRRARARPRGLRGPARPTTSRATSASSRISWKAPRPSRRAAPSGGRTSSGCRPRRMRGLGGHLAGGGGGDPGPEAARGAPHPPRAASGGRQQEPRGAAPRNQPPDPLPEASEWDNRALCQQVPIFR